jgi:hypothetical protein
VSSFHASAPAATLAGSAIFLALLLAPVAASASTYQALCDNKPCTIRLDARGMEGPAGVIQANRIAKWMSLGRIRTGSAAGRTLVTAGTSLITPATYFAPAGLGAPIGLAGSLVGRLFGGLTSGREVDLAFEVIGYDDEGRRLTQSFRFVNPKPAEQVRQLLPGISGLAMGQIRPLEDLHRSFDEPGSPDGLPERLQRVPPQTVAATSSSWQAYLESRGLVPWAEANPQHAERLRRKLFPDG